jgi:hypothetical protein
LKSFEKQLSYHEKSISSRWSTGE